MRINEIINQNLIEFGAYHRRQIFNTLSTAGYKKLGSGVDAEVWSKTGNYVIKILIPIDSKMKIAEKGFLEYYNFCRANLGNPFLVRFLPIEGKDYTTFLIDGERFYQIAMEKLTHFNYYINQPSKFTSIVYPCIKTIKLNGRFENAKISFPPWIKTDSKQLQKAEKFFNTLLNLRRWAKIKNISLDFHAENIMLRGKTPVITDPFYAGRKFNR